ncbi:MAG: ABC transporter substrate-binding protein [Fibrobacter sp.]|nr:ABC transporter substrate-binding protein [Fibrobacter sp.]
MKLRFPGYLLVLVVFLLTGCVSQKADDNTNRKTVCDTLMDAAGRTVCIPARVNRVISPFTMYTRLIAALGGCDKLAGISHTCLLPEELYGCNGVLGQLPDIGPFGANIELIASLNPDLIFASQSDIGTFTSKTDASVVAVSFSDNLSMLEMFNRQIDIIGKALRLEKQADSLKTFISSVLEPVITVTSNIPDTARPRVYFAWTSWTGDILNTVCEFDPIELAGGINVAREATNFSKGERGILVSREHILNWNPEFIFISRYQPQKWHQNGTTSPIPVTIQNVIDKRFLQTVDAVKNKNVFYTTAFCNWWPHQRALVQILYMAKLFHPGLFADLDVEEQGNKIFKRFYGEDSLYTTMAEELELYRW